MTPLASVLAAGGGKSLLLVIIGVVIVAVLLFLFWRGRRNVEERPSPPQEPQPRSGSWEEPDSRDNDQ
ncbi:DUF6479 family protein [Streptomyces monticola]|uniref:DUF6479 family protein n=1 Tax=Streptomyces monticola TaxID=2666263 RepID=A0ABW2JEP5_9ACTN